MNSLEFEDEERAPGIFVVTLRGQFDFTYAPDARQAMRHCIEAGARRLVVNMDGVEYVDSAGLGTLVGTLAAMREHDGELSIVCNNVRIRRVFEITKLSQILTIYSTEDEAGVPRKA